MRISDWSSDVCSSDLIGGELAARALRKADDRRVGVQHLQSLHDLGIGRDHPALELRRAEAARPAIEQLHRLDPLLDLARQVSHGNIYDRVDDRLKGLYVAECQPARRNLARKSVVSGKGGSVRVALGGRRSYK